MIFFPRVEYIMIRLQKHLLLKIGCIAMVIVSFVFMIYYKVHRLTVHFGILQVFQSNKRSVCGSVSQYLRHPIYLSIGQN